MVTDRGQIRSPNHRDMHYHHYLNLTSGIRHQAPKFRPPWWPITLTPRRKLLAGCEEQINFCDVWHIMFLQLSNRSLAVVYLRGHFSSIEMIVTTKDMCYHMKADKMLRLMMKICLKITQRLTEITRDSK